MLPDVQESKAEIIERFARHVSSGKAAFFFLSGLPVLHFLFPSKDGTTYGGRGDGETLFEAARVVDVPFAQSSLALELDAIAIGDGVLDSCGSYPAG